MSIHITTHKGKLDKIPSLNTDNTTNEFCKSMSKCRNLICSKCYANRLLAFRKSLKEKLEVNSEIMSTRILKQNEIPIFNNLYVRFNSFGELINRIHLQNILLICINNPRTTFTLWSKRANLIKELPSKPNNLILIYSNPIINPVSTKIPKGYDKIFNVYTKAFIKENNININCLKSCMNCLKCYTFNNIKQINEVIR